MAGDQRRRALITGAGRGIGRACAIALAGNGLDLVLVARTRDELEHTARTARRAGVSALVAEADVTDVAALEAGFALAPVDVLVNAAGTNHPEPFADVPLERLDALVALNVRSTFVACQLAVRDWLARGVRGVIVTISSQMGHVGAPNRTVYCMTKHAVEGLTKALAVELAPHGIRAVTVAPTFVETAMTAAALADPDQRDEIVAQIPLGFVGSPEDVAAAVVFATSAEARLVTGSSLLVDGGWTAR
jgi:NAD(P)-dependent dehydrogenase (short-subunit alcohol dehydrogenase family)